MKIMTAALLMIPSILLMGCSTPATKDKPLIYTLSQDSAKPDHLSVNIDTSHLKAVVMQAPRILNNTNASQFYNLQCHSKGASTSLPMNESSHCDSVSLTIPLWPVPEQGIPANKQLSYYSPSGWTLLTEEGNLPRIAHHQAIICPPEGKPCVDLSNEDEPPTLLTWGGDTRSINIGNSVMTLYADNPALYDPAIFNVFEKQIHYLNKVFLNDQPIKNWHVVWLKKEKRSHSMGGAAYKNAFTANYLVDNGQLITDKMPRLLRTSAHESVHILSPYSMTMWLNESLAEYYGFKSLNRSGMASQNPTEEWRHARERLPHANAGLYRANSAVRDDNDMSYYPLFYVKGAAFWYALDNLLVEKGETLDHFILLLSDKEKPTALPVAFIDAVTKVVGKNAWQQLEKDYLM